MQGERVYWTDHHWWAQLTHPRRFREKCGLDIWAVSGVAERAWLRRPFATPDEM